MHWGFHGLLANAVVLRGSPRIHCKLKYRIRFAASVRTTTLWLPERIAAQASMIRIDPH
jgi:hypothetical protein